MRLLLLVVSIVFALSACVAGPTPHPGQEETMGGAPPPDPSAPSAQEGQDASTGGIGGDGDLDENTADALDDGDGTDAGDTATDVDVVGDTAADVGPEKEADAALDTSSD